MNEDFVTYEQALALKKLGFKEECFYHYDYNNPDDVIPNNDIDITLSANDFKISYNIFELYNEIRYDAPTLTQVQKWFRVKHKQSIEPKYDIHQWWCCITNMSTSDWYDLDKSYASYEEALSAGITLCLKLLEK